MSRFPSCATRSSRRCAKVAAMPWLYPVIIVLAIATGVILSSTTQRRVQLDGLPAAGRRTGRVRRRDAGSQAAVRPVRLAGLAQRCRLVHRRQDDIDRPGRRLFRRGRRQMVARHPRSHRRQLCHARGRLGGGGAVGLFRGRLLLRQRDHGALGRRVSRRRFPAAPSHAALRSCLPRPGGDRAGLAALGRLVSRQPDEAVHHRLCRLPFSN